MMPVMTSFWIWFRGSIRLLPGYQLNTTNLNPIPSPEQLLQLDICKNNFHFHTIVLNAELVETLYNLRGSGSDPIGWLSGVKMAWYVFARRGQETRLWNPNPGKSHPRSKPHSSQAHILRIVFCKWWSSDNNPDWLRLKAGTWIFELQFASNSALPMCRIVVNCNRAPKKILSILFRWLHLLYMLQLVCVIRFFLFYRYIIFAILQIYVKCD